MIEIDNVSFAYDKEPVIHNLSLEIADGEMLAILGPNSSGKSTLLRLMAGIIKPDTGSIRIKDHEISELSRREAAKLVSFVPQETPVSFPFRVFEIVLMGRTPHLSAFSFEGEEDFRIAGEALNMTDTYPLRARYLDELSGGERQLVIMARSLAQAAPIMLLDEPTSFLDIRHQVQILEIIARLNRKQSKTIVLISHDLNLASLYCDRLVLLREGIIVADGTPDEVLSSRVLQETYQVKMTVSKGPAGRPFLIPDRDSLQKEGMD